MCGYYETKVLWQETYRDKEFFFSCDPMAKRTSFFCMYSENVGTSNVAGANVAINVDDNPKSLPPSPRQTTDYIN